MWSLTRVTMAAGKKGEIVRGIGRLQQESLMRLRHYVSSSRGSSVNASALVRVRLHRRTKRRRNCWGSFTTFVRTTTTLHVVLHPLLFRCRRHVLTGTTAHHLVRQQQYPHDQSNRRLSINPFATKTRSTTLVIVSNFDSSSYKSWQALTRSILLMALYSLAVAPFSVEFPAELYLCLRIFYFLPFKEQGRNGLYTKSRKQSRVFAALVKNRHRHTVRLWRKSTVARAHTQQFSRQLLTHVHRHTPVTPLLAIFLSLALTHPHIHTQIHWHTRTPWCGCGPSCVRVGKPPLYSARPSIVDWW